MKMLRKICLALTLTVGTLSSFAQFTTGGKKYSKPATPIDYTLQSGYKGMVDFGYGIGVGDFGYGRVEFQTAHGYQFNPYFFAGVGAGISYYHETDDTSVPIFADFRGSLPIRSSRLSPFVDFKIGYAVANVKGFYFSPAAGFRVALSKRAGFNFSVGYEVQTADWWSGIYLGPDDYYIYMTRHNCGAVTLKIGFDF